VPKLCSSPLNDLRWVLTSPNMLSSTHELFRRVSTPSNDEINIVMKAAMQPEFAAHLEKRKSHFLGAYFEHLWLFYLKHSPRYELIASNLQVNEQGKTIGEFDIIAFDKHEQRYLHQELAIKYYLGHNQPQESETRWIGPQSVDRLDIKMGKLINQQLRLSENVAAKNVLQNLDIKQVEPQLLIKGCLFQRRQNNAPNQAYERPDYVDPEHVQATWLPFKELATELGHEQSPHDYWKVLEKPEWLAPITLKITSIDEYDIMTTEELISRLTHQQNTNGRALLISRLNKEKGKERNLGRLISTEKIFAVPHCWPLPRKPSPALQTSGVNK